MTNDKEYFRPSVTIEQEKAIDDLFKKYENVSDFYGGKKGKFVEDAIRRLLIFYDELYLRKETSKTLEKSIEI